MRVEYLDDCFRVYTEPGSPESSQVRDLPTRRWDPTNACWEVDAVRENVETLAAWGWLPEDFDEDPQDFPSAVRISRERNALLLKSPPSYAPQCKGIPDRRFWKPGKGAWVVQASSRNLEYLSKTFPRADWTPEAKALLAKAVGLKEEAKALAERKASDKEPETGGYMFNEVYPPYDHQRTAFGMARDAHAFAWLMEMGTGKTRVDVDETVDLHRRGKLAATLVICPNSIKDPWAEEARKMAPPWAKVDLRVWDASLGKRAKAELLAWVNKTPPKGDPTVYIFVMNVESMSHKSGVAVAEAFVAHHNAVKITVDESSRIKNPSAKRTKAVIALGKMPSVKFKRIMSGTPVPQGPLDYFAQFMFLDPNILGYSSFYSFRNHFAEMGGWEGKEVVGYRNLDELQRLVDPFSYRVLRRDCMDLPPKVYEKRYVDLTKEQERLYREMADKMVADLAGRKITATIVLTQMLRLQQIIGGFLPPEAPPDLTYEELYTWKKEHPEEATPIPGANPKVDALLELAEDVPGKTIVWARFRSELDIISRALKKAYGPGSVAEFHGGVSNEKRTEGRLAFQDPKSKVRFFVGQTETGGLGITLTEAEVVVYFSNSFSLESRLQSEDRAHRAGTRHTVTYVDLVARATLDTKLLDALRGKKNMADVITGDDISKWI